MRILFPNKIFDNFTDITPDFLIQNNIKGVILDIDGTLVDSKTILPDMKIKNHIKQLSKKGLILCIASNNSQSRVSKFCKELGLNFIYRANKPLRYNLKKACDMIKTQPQNTCIIGDQILTDVYGGNRSGLYTILVTPIESKSGAFTKLKRRIERVILKKYEKRGGNID